VLDVGQSNNSAPHVDIGETMAAIDLWRLSEGGGWREEGERGGERHE
jgi:hypothetical protein